MKNKYGLGLTAYIGGNFMQYASLVVGIDCLIKDDIPSTVILGGTYVLAKLITKAGDINLRDSRKPKNLEGKLKEEN